MTPAARVQAAIEIVDLVIAAARDNGASADKIISEWFRIRRFAGSSDRRAVREWAYRAIRACGEMPNSGRAAMVLLARDDPALAALFDGGRHAPAPIAADEPVAQAGTAPAWLMTALAASGIAGDAAAALLGRAPLDLRVNRLKADRATIALPMAGETLATPDGLRLPAGTAVESWDAWRDGLVEVQDAGSQWVCAAVATRPGEVVIDLCAGAGGKTLALAADMAGPGAGPATENTRLIAADTDRGRLGRLSPRAARAGAVVETVLLNPGQEVAALTVVLGDGVRADAVLVDAPCSGTGTWRRNPETRWRLTPRALDRLIALQAHVLDVAAALARPGGRVIYVTCSLLDAEGSDQVAAFVQRHPDWRVETPRLGAGRAHGLGWRLDPARDGTDGFFIARLLAP